MSQLDVGIDEIDRVVVLVVRGVDVVLVVTPAPSRPAGVSRVVRRPLGLALPDLVDVGQAQECLEIQACRGLAQRLTTQPIGVLEPSPVEVARGVLVV